MKTYSDTLKCYWNKIEAIDDCQINIYLPENCCCDMKGATAIAENISKFIYVICVYSGESLDIVYEKLDKYWIARDSRKKR